MKLEIEKRSVRSWYVSTGKPDEFKLRRRIIPQFHFVIKVDLFELPLLIKVQKFNFQHQEDWMKLEIEKRSVRSWYVSIAKLG